MWINKKEIKNKIYSIKYVHKIIKSMEMISISKLKKFNNLLFYNNKYYNIIINLITNLDLIQNSNFYIKNNCIINNKFLFLIIFTDQGLCGNLNFNLIKKFLFYVNNNNINVNNVKLLLFGKKSISLIKYFRNFNCDIKFINYNFQSKTNIYNNLKIISNKIINFYNKFYFDKIFIVNNYLNKNKVKYNINQILPLNYLSEKFHYFRYYYETKKYILKENIFFKYISIKILNGILNNIVAEHFTRIFVMQGASKNSDILFNRLNIIYNKLRQYNITKEIIELVSTLN